MNIFMLVLKDFLFTPFRRYPPLILLVQFSNVAWCVISLRDGHWLIAVTFAILFVFNDLLNTKERR